MLTKFCFERYQKGGLPIHAAESAPASAAGAAASFVPVFAPAKPLEELAEAVTFQFNFR